MEKSKDSVERRRFWEQHLRDYKSSGLSQAEYCRQHELSLKSFLYWKRKDKGVSKAVCLVEVPVQRQPQVSFPPYASSLRLVVGNHYRIELDRGFDTQALDQLLGFLERR